MAGYPELGLAEVPARLWLVDDDEGLRASLAAVVCRGSAEVELTGSFGTASAALEAAQRGGIFDVGLIDIRLPDASGVALILALRKWCPVAPLLAFTMRSDEEAVFSALGAGACGYLTKVTPMDMVIAAVREALRGAAPLDASISRSVVSRFWRAGAAEESLPFGLTRREREVLEVLCSGASYRETAQTLDLAEGTVQTHVKRIYEKLGVTSKAEAVRAACEAGIGLR